eukprot:CAMPEP_0204351212 /NCGR_PEP_ID=MMETSP0469-20131031/30937_1 /ASSEMBLY_ACC=CAM_ASM_000384 /TAXON_ID=2969 /ORGANISM="Oxyrrhis marina" /LENGTH=86 /DNA_ID=CAMNT_0051337707 /DNA_START=18 /DNA_END=279 /DNA_ORIENTATION=+
MIRRGASAEGDAEHFWVKAGDVSSWYPEAVNLECLQDRVNSHQFAKHDLRACDSEALQFARDILTNTIRARRAHFGVIEISHVSSM